MRRILPRKKRKKGCQEQAISRSLAAQVVGICIMDSLLWVCPQECVAGNTSNKAERVLRNGDHAASRFRLGSQFLVGGRVGSRSLFSRHCGCWGSSSSSSSAPGIQIWRTQNGSRQAVSIRAGEFFSFFFWQLYANET